MADYLQIIFEKGITVWRPDVRSPWELLSGADEEARKVTADPATKYGIRPIIVTHKSTLELGGLLVSPGGKCLDLEVSQFQQLVTQKETSFMTEMFNLVYVAGGCVIIADSCLGCTQRFVLGFPPICLMPWEIEPSFRVMRNPTTNLMPCSV